MSNNSVKKVTLLNKREKEQMWVTCTATLTISSVVNIFQIFEGSRIRKSSVRADDHDDHMMSKFLFLVQ